MRIAQIVPPYLSVPPKKYGGTELIASHITEELVRRGHQVTLFASGDSQTKAKLVSTFPKSLYHEGIPWSDAYYPLLHSSLAFKKAQNFDIIHNHFHYFGLCFSSFVNAPVVTTYHGDFATAEKNPAKFQTLEQFKKSYFVSISNAQRKFSKININFVATVYNGIDLKDFTFNDKSQNYLVWLGRITPKKGLIEAIKAAKLVKIPLKIAAKVDKNHLPDVEFYEKKIKPLFDGRQVQYLGEIGPVKKNALLKNALALLNPIKWNEPFGLVMPEAMACGTPVIAFDKGSVPEIVQNGKTGFIIPATDKNGQSNIKGLVDSIKKIYSIDRKKCRRQVEKKFSVEKMTDDYEKVYEKIIKKHQKK